MAHPDIHSLGVVDQLQKLQNVLKIVQRLPNSHQNDVGNGCAAVMLRIQDLVQNFSRRQIPDLPAQGGRAERAPHPAPHLAGGAHGIAVLVAHKHRLHAVSVPEPPQIFDCPVLLGRLFAGDFRPEHVAQISQLFPQHFGEIAHLLQHSAPAQPGKELLGPEGRLFQLLEQRGQLLRGHGAVVHHWALPPFRSLQRKKPSVPSMWGQSVLLSSMEKFGCPARNCAATSSFSRRKIVQVL